MQRILSLCCQLLHFSSSSMIRSLSGTCMMAGRQASGRPPVRHDLCAALHIVAAPEPCIICCAAPAAVVPAQLPPTVAPLPSAFLQVPRSLVSIACL